MNEYLLSVFAETPAVDSSKIPVTGEKGGSITLPYTFRDQDIIKITLAHFSKKTRIVCDKKCSDQKTSGIILKNLNISDAGTYTLNVFYDENTHVLEPQITKYELQIHGKVKTDPSTFFSFFLITFTSG